MDAFLFTLASFAGLSAFADYLTSNILNETLSDPLVRIPINAALVSAFLKYIFEKSRQMQINLEDLEDKDKEEDGVGDSNDGGRSSS